MSRRQIRLSNQEFHVSTRFNKTVKEAYQRPKYLYIAKSEGRFRYSFPQDLGGHITEVPLYLRLGNFKGKVKKIVWKVISCFARPQ